MTPDRLAYKDVNHFSTTAPVLDPSSLEETEVSNQADRSHEVAQSQFQSYSLWGDYRGPLGLLSGYQYALLDEASNLHPLHLLQRGDEGNNTNDFQPPEPQIQDGGLEEITLVEESPRYLPAEDLIHNLQTYLDQIKILCRTKDKRAWDPSSACQVLACFEEDCASLDRSLLNSEELQQLARVSYENLWAARFYVLQRLFNDKRTKDAARHLDAWLSPLKIHKKQEVILLLLSSCKGEQGALIAAAIILQARRAGILSCEEALDSYLGAVSYAGDEAFKLWQVACQNWSLDLYREKLILIAKRGISHWTYKNKIELDDLWMVDIFSPQDGMNGEIIALWTATQDASLQHRIFTKLLLVVATTHSGYRQVVHLLVESRVRQACWLDILYHHDPQKFIAHASALTHHLLHIDSRKVLIALPWEQMLAAILQNMQHTLSWGEVLSYLLRKGLVWEHYVQALESRWDETVLSKGLSPRALQHLPFSLLPRLRTAIMAHLKEMPKGLKNLFDRLVKINTAQAQEELYFWVTGKFEYFLHHDISSIMYLLQSESLGEKFLCWVCDNLHLLSLKKHLAHHEKNFVRCVIEKTTNTAVLFQLIQDFGLTGHQIVEAASRILELLNQRAKEHGVEDSCINEIMTLRDSLGREYMLLSGDQVLIVSILSQATSEQQEKALRVIHGTLKEKRMLLGLYQKLGRKDLLEAKFYEWPQTDLWCNVNNPSLALFKLFKTAYQMTEEGQSRTVFLQMVKEDKQSSWPQIICLSWNHFPDERDSIQDRVFEIYTQIVSFLDNSDEDRSWEVSKVVLGQLIHNVPSGVLPLERCLGWHCLDFPMESRKRPHANHIFNFLLHKARTALIEWKTASGDSAVNSEFINKLGILLLTYHLANAFDFQTFHVAEGMSYIALESLKQSIYNLVRDKFKGSEQKQYADIIAICEFKARDYLLSVSAYKCLDVQTQFLLESTEQSHALHLYLLSKHFDYLADLWECDQKKRSAPHRMGASKLVTWTNTQEDQRWLGQDLYLSLALRTAKGIVELFNRPYRGSQEEEMLRVQEVLSSFVNSLVFLREDKTAQMWGGEEKAFATIVLCHFMDRLAILLQHELNIISNRGGPIATTDGESFYLWSHAVEIMPIVLLDLANKISSEIPITALDLHVMFSASLFKLYTNLAACKLKVIDQLIAFEPVPVRMTENRGGISNKTSDDQHPFCRHRMHLMCPTFIDNAKRKLALEHQRLMTYYQKSIEHISDLWKKENRGPYTEEIEFITACSDSSLTLLDIIRTKLTANNSNSDTDDVEYSSSEDEFLDDFM